MPLVIGVIIENFKIINSVLREKVFEPCFDYAFIGEGDNSWPDFLKKYENKEDISQVKGIIYRDNNEIKFTGMALPVHDVNSIPIPSRHLLKSELYNLGTIQGIKKFTTIMTMRGCPFNCIFCSTKVFGKDKKMRDNKREEIKVHSRGGEDG